MSETEAAGSDPGFRELVERSPLPVWVHRDLTPLFVNRAATKLLGYDAPEEILALGTLSALFGPDQYRCFAAFDARCRNGGERPPQHEARCLRKDGSEIALRILAGPVVWDGAPATQAALVDVSDRVAAEDALQESRRQLTRAAAIGRFGYWVWDEVLDRAIFCSDQLAEIYGVADGEMLKRRLASFEADLAWVHPEDRAHFTEERRKSKTETGLSELSFRIVRADGEIRYLREISEPFFDAQGRQLRSAGVSLDVTAEKLSEEALHESAFWLRRSEEMARIGHWVWYGPRISDWNLAGEKAARPPLISEGHRRIFGLEPGVTLGDGRLTLAEDKERLLRILEEAERKAEGFRIERRRIRRPDGEIRTILDVGDPKLRPDGSIELWHGVVQDITSQEATERALRESELLLREIADAVPALISYADADRVYRFANREYERRFGISSENVAGMRMEEVLGTESYARLKPEIDRAYAGEEVTYIDDAFDRAGNRWCTLENRIPQFDEAGRVRGIVTVAHDITLLKDTEEQLHQAQKMEAIGQLTGGIAHDFNNLLGVIIGNLELARDELSEGSAARACIETAMRGADRGAALVQRLLAFSRRQPLRPEAVRADELVRSMIDLLRRSLGAAIEIEMIGQADLWLCEVDPAQLEVALLNLALNARDAMPAGGKLTIGAANVRLDETDATLQAELEPGHYVLLAVTDGGAGMSPEVAAHAFEPFFTTKTVGAGSGLGLSMVYGFVKQSGGHVTIDSAPGRGTTVRLYLPRFLGRVAAAAEVPESVELPTARGETILLVEDDRDLRGLVGRMLESLGYRVSAAASGAPALARLQADPGIALLLTDVVLPGDLGGRELAARASRLRPDLPILYMSGYSQNAIIHDGRLADGVQLLQKPFRKTEIAQAVRRALDGAG